MKMLTITGTPIDGRSLPAFTWNADLIAFDGPLLSLFKSEYGTDALFAWLDCDARKNRWGIVDVSRDTLKGYLEQSLSLLDVFKKSTSVVVFDSSSGARKGNIKRTQWSQLPKEYLPDADSFLLPEISTLAAVNLAAEQSAKYQIKLAGELYIEDLASIPKLYQQLYSFHYGLEHLTRPAIRSTIASLIGKWKGGFSAVNLFTGLRNVTPSIHRARLNHLYYNSPGHITMELLPGMAKRIKDSAHYIGTETTYFTSEKLYREIYTYFRENKISGFEDERGSKEAKLMPQQVQELREFVDRFMVLLHWQDYKNQFTSLDIGPLSQLRALLAYYRRLRKLLAYVTNGLIELT